MMTEEEIGHAIIGAAIKIHSVVGPGLLESAYQACLSYELRKFPLDVRQQVVVPIRYEETVIDQGLSHRSCRRGLGGRSNRRLSKPFCQYIAVSFSAISASATS